MASDEHAMDAMRYFLHIAKIQNEYDKMCEENSVREYDEKVCLRTCPFYKVGGLYCKRAYFYQKALEEAAAKCKECKLERKEALDCYEDLCQREIQEAKEKFDRYRWHDLRKNPDDLPIPEREVDVVCVRKFAGKSVYVYTHGMYEDGTIRENDSEWNWIDIDGEYDEEEDCYIVPRGWWEYKHYCHYDEYNNIIDDEVIAWKEIDTFEGDER